MHRAHCAARNTFASLIARSSRRPHGHRMNTASPQNLMMSPPNRATTVIILVKYVLMCFFSSSALSRLASRVNPEMSAKNSALNTSFVDGTGSADPVSS